MHVRHWRFLTMIVVSVVLSASEVLADGGLYEQMMKERMLNNIRSAPAWKDVPDPIKMRYSECFAAAVVAGLTKDELRQMNDGAQGVRVEDALAQKALDQLITIIAKLNNRDLSVLDKVCPGDIADFEKAGL